ncbi:CYFA0S04e00386g1_1 [Cyberlindnera fabianii]|uniref:CYFA0S04e00386g1_1 n=1 Tax=Cyberlindnera fabianii TaxID=36022 RepID=A0A061AQJ0_CYBFA|nr:CYFA0S04e00386g1_1 [Cyberlindnera fabianii]
MSINISTRSIPAHSVGTTEMLVGRASQNKKSDRLEAFDNLFLPDRTVSKQHCLIKIHLEKDSNEWLAHIKDLNSHHGTVVGDRLLRPGVWTELKEGDLIGLVSLSKEKYEENESQDGEVPAVETQTTACKFLLKYQGVDDHTANFNFLSKKEVVSLREKANKLRSDTHINKTGDYLGDLAAELDMANDIVEEEQIEMYSTLDKLAGEDEGIELYSRVTEQCDEDDFDRLSISREPSIGSSASFGGFSDLREPSADTPNASLLASSESASSTNAPTENDSTTPVLISSAVNITDVTSGEDITIENDGFKELDQVTAEVDSAKSSVPEEDEVSEIVREETFSTSSSTRDQSTRPYKLVLKPLSRRRAKNATSTTPSKVAKRKLTKKSSNVKKEVLTGLVGFAVGMTMGAGLTFSTLASLGKSMSS